MCVSGKMKKGESVKRVSYLCKWGSSDARPGALRRWQRGQVRAGPEARDIVVIGLWLIGRGARRVRGLCVACYSAASGIIFVLFLFHGPFLSTSLSTFFFFFGLDFLFL